MSERMRARRHHPMDDAIWLLEHVSKTKGANYLKLSSTSLSFFQFYSLDVMLAAAAVFTVPIAMWIRVRMLFKKNKLD
jgi:hypothetical protein